MAFTENTTQTALGRVMPFFDKLARGWSQLTNSIVSTDLHPGLIQYKEVAITAAEMLALRATPKTLVAAPGSGYLLEFISATFIYDYVAAFTESSDNLAIRFTDSSGVIASLTLETTGLLDATNDELRTIKPLATDIEPVANSPLVLHNTGDGEFGGTGSPCRVKIAYRVHATGL